METIYDRRRWHIRINFMGMAMRTMLVLMLALIILGCDTTTETVSIDDVFWSAFRNPESFDTYLGTQTLDPRTSNCFLQRRDAAFASEDAKLLECSVILQGSTAWNECHDEVDAFHNNGVIMNDIANTIDGTTRFDESSAYAFLIISKSALTEADWNAFIDSLNEITPHIFCEYEGEEQWFWE